MPYMTNVQRTMKENVQKGERRGEHRGLQKGLQKGLPQHRESLCRMAEKKFNGRTSKQLETLLKPVDEPAVFGQVAESIIDCDSAKEFIAACKKLGSS